MILEGKRWVAVVAMAGAIALAFAALERAVAQPQGFVVVRRDPAGGMASLVVDERQLAREGRAMGFRLESICRYEADRQRWEPVRLALPRCLQAV